MQVHKTDALIRVDLQNDFCVGGALAVQGADAAFIERCNALAARFRSAGATVVDTQDFHPAGHRSFASQHPGKAPFDVVQFPYGPQVLWPDHCVQGTRGSDPHNALNTDLAHLVLRKGMRLNVDSYSAFYENDKTTHTGLHGYLHGRDVRRVFVCGLAYDYCVGYTALDARKLAFAQVNVVSSHTRVIAADTTLAMNSALRAANIKRLEL
jgi:nicotinamidase/pyrazinamidase